MDEKRIGTQVHGMSDPPPMRVGIAVFCADWFRTSGYDPARLVHARSADVRALVELHFDVIDGGVISRQAEAREVAQTFREGGVELVVVIIPVWAEDGPVTAFAMEMRHVSLWLVDLCSYVGLPPNVHDQNVFFAHTELVGLLQANASLRRVRPDVRCLTFDKGMVRGTDDLRLAIVAFVAARRLRGKTIGLCPARTEAIRCTAVDELAVERYVGCQVRHSSVEDLFAAYDDVTAERVIEYLSRLEALTDMTSFRGDGLLQSGRLALAVRDLCVREGLDALALDDLSPHLHSRFGLRPCLIARGVLDGCPPIALEADLASAICMLALETLMAAPTAMVEPFFVVPEKHAILFGHAGGCDPRLARDDGVRVDCDMEYLHSADRFPGSPSFMIAGQPGAVVLMNLQVDSSGVTILFFRGVATSHKRLLPGYSEFLVKTELEPFDILRRFVDHGCTQHFVLCYGDCGDALVHLARECRWGCSPLC